MKVKLCLFILMSICLATVLAGCSGELVVPDDFAVKINFGLSEYDSENGRLVKETRPSGMWGNTLQDYTAKYFLTAEQKTKIYQMIMDMDFDSYPDNYNPCEGDETIPAYTVVLKIKHDGIEKEVSCHNIASLNNSDYYQKNRPEFWENLPKESKDFIILHETIIDMIRSSEEWKALPDYDVIIE